MKRTLAIVIALFAMASSATAQRIPDSSVTGSARATVGINPAALVPGGDSGIQNAYDPSWTMLVGNPSQTLIPHKFAVQDLNFTYLEGGRVQIDSSAARYNCVIEERFGRDREKQERCTFVTMYPVQYVMSPASGRGTTRLAFTYQTYSGPEYIVTDYYGGSTFNRYQVTLGPVINELGALTGFTFQTADDDYFYGTYNNATLTRFSGPVTLPAYFCDPQNACGYQRGSWTVSN